MTQYRITYTRPYLPEPERSEVQRGIVVAKDEAEVRDIYQDCEITFIEELHPVVAAQEVEKQFSDDWCDPRVDNGLYDDVIYRPGSADGDIPF